MRLVIFAVASFGMTAPFPAHASALGDEFGRCVAEKISDADKTELTRWLFAAMTRDPALAPLTTLTQADRDKLNKSIADLYDRLVLVDCRVQAVAALKSEGPQIFRESGRALGTAAISKMLSSPIQAEIKKFLELEDDKNWNALAREAGIKADEK